MAQDRIAVFDQSDVHTITDMETNIDLCINRMAKKNMRPLIIVDSLHSVIDPTSGHGIRENVMDSIRSVKRISNVRDTPVVGVVELRKSGYSGRHGQANTKPRLRDISETIDIEYRITVGMMLHNELQLLRGNSTKYWFDTDHREERSQATALPIIELLIEKNKEGYFKGDILLKSQPFFSDMIEMSETDLQTMTANAPLSNLPTGTGANATSPNPQPRQDQPPMTTF
jgi:hypothetical protein